MNELADTCRDSGPVSSASVLLVDTRDLHFIYNGMVFVLCLKMFNITKPEFVALL